MANARVVLIKPYELTRDEELKQPGDVLIVPVDVAKKIVSGGYGVLNADFSESMLPKKAKLIKPSDVPAQTGKAEKPSDVPNNDEKTSETEKTEKPSEVVQDKKEESKGGK